VVVAKRILLTLSSFGLLLHAFGLPGAFMQGLSGAFTAAPPWNVFCCIWGIPRHFLLHLGHTGAFSTAFGLPGTFSAAFGAYRGIFYCVWPPWDFFYCIWGIPGHFLLPLASLGLFLLHLGHFEKQERLVAGFDSLDTKLAEMVKPNPEIESQERIDMKRMENNDLRQSPAKDVQSILEMLANKNKDK
jgi:hypothetical protein